MLRGKISYQVTFGSFSDGKFNNSLPSELYYNLLPHSNRNDVFVQEHYVGASTNYSTFITEEEFNSSENEVKNDNTWEILTKAEYKTENYTEYGYKVNEFSVSKSTIKTDLPSAFRSFKIRKTEIKAGDFTVVLSLSKRFNSNKKYYNISISSNTAFTQEDLDFLFKFINNSPLLYTELEKQRAIHQVNSLFDSLDTQKFYDYNPKTENLKLSSSLFRYYSMPIMGNIGLLIYTKDGIFLHNKTISRVADSSESQLLAGQVFKCFVSPDGEYYAFDCLTSLDLTYEYRLRHLNEAQKLSKYLKKINIWINHDTENFYTNNALFLERSNKILFVPNTNYLDFEMPHYMYNVDRTIKLKLHVYPDMTAELLNADDELFEGSKEHPLYNYKLTNFDNHRPGIYEFKVDFVDEWYQFTISDTKTNLPPAYKTVEIWNDLHESIEPEQFKGVNLSDFYTVLTDIKSSFLKGKRGSLLIVGTDVLNVRLNSELFNSFMEVFHVTTTQQVYPETVHIHVPDYNIRTIYTAITQFRKVPFEYIICDTSLSEVGIESILEINRIFKSINGNTLIIDFDKNELEEFKYSENNIAHRSREGKVTTISYNVVFDNNDEKVIDKKELDENVGVRKIVAQNAKLQAARSVRTRYGSLKEKTKFGQLVYQNIMDEFDNKKKQGSEIYSIPSLGMDTRYLVDFRNLTGGNLMKLKLPDIITYETKMYLNLISIYMI